MGTLWVYTGTGKPVGFTERIGRDNYREAAITKDMVEKEIPVEVPDSAFWRGKINEGLLKSAPDAASAKAKYDAWLKSKEKPKAKPVKSKEEQE
ncbi:MAG: hypothetical protein PHX83_12105 [Acidobacteriia bacterium]|nr:hypothetical protein [Terriglobia bacterium]